MRHNEVAVYGAGGFGREIAWLVESLSREPESYRVVCYVDDNPEMCGSVLNEVPVMSLESAYAQYPHARIVGAIGSPQIRQFLMEKAAKQGFSFLNVVHPRVERSRWITMGNGIVICAGNILTTNITLGDHVQINLDCTIGHDVVLDDFTTLAPGVHVSGFVHCGKRVYVGTGATIINGTYEKPIVVNDDAVIGAGACVTKSVPKAVTVVGIPARPLGGDRS